MNNKSRSGRMCVSRIGGVEGDQLTRICKVDQHDEQRCEEHQWRVLGRRVHGVPKTFRNPRALLPGWQLGLAGEVPQQLETRRDKTDSLRPRLASRFGAARFRSTPLGRRRFSAMESIQSIGPKGRGMVKGASRAHKWIRK